MQFKYMIQRTPNPNAIKVVVNRDIMLKGKRDFTNNQQAKDVPLAYELFKLEFIKQIHFFRNFITLTKHNNFDWSSCEEKIIDLIKSCIDSHNPDIAIPEAIKKPVPKNCEEIDALLEKYIRPSLRGDGGDVDIISFDEKKNVLVIEYKGACNHCPSASFGTLNAIEQFLLEKLKKEIKVEIIGM